ncbi:MAG: NUDIX domain-containing protein [Bacteroidales bacterium]|nr:NUDIX domain-containing protein [Bacteroidales bacterium]
MYKISYSNKSLFVVNRNTFKNLQDGNFCKIINDFEISSFFNILNEINADNKNKDFFILCSNSKSFFSKIKKEIKVIKAAGGMVLDSRGRVLMIYRKGFWDLPKGKIERKESTKEAAIREVEEECGLCKLEITGKLKPSYHIYEEGNRFILKKSIWFLMLSKDKKAPVPQSCESITKAVWMEKKMVGKIIDEAYDNIKDLLVKFYL